MLMNFGLLILQGHDSLLEFFQRQREVRQRFEGFVYFLLGFGTVKFFAYGFFRQGMQQHMLDFC